MYPAELEIKDTTESTTSASYLDLLLSIGRDGQFSNFHLRQARWFQFSTSQTFRSWVVIFHHRRPMACLSLNLYDTPGLAPRMNVFILRARRLSCKLLKQGYLVERLNSSFRKFYGRYGDLIEQYGATLSRMLNEHSDPWPTVTSLPIRLSTYFMTFYTELDLHQIMSGFPWSFLPTGVASQQGTLTLPDIWFRPPFWDLLVLQLLRPNSSNLPCLYSTFNLEYPLVLSRFCFLVLYNRDRWTIKSRKHNYIHEKFSFGAIILWLFFCRQ